MAKKPQKKHQTAKNSKSNQSVENLDSLQLEHSIKQEFEESLRRLRGLEKEYPNIAASKDMESLHYKRRVQAAIALAPRIKEIADEICPDIPDLFSVYGDWGWINAVPIKGYEEQEESMNLILGASIWILDRIKQSGQMNDAIQILPRNTETLESVDIPDIYDPVHDIDIIRATVFSISHRNDDCLQSGQNAKKKGKKKDLPDRVIADRFTIKNQQHQIVPSRIRFEKLLSFIPENEIEKAVENYEDRLFAWMKCYYRCRALLCEKEYVILKRQRQIASSFNTRAKQIVSQHKLSVNPLNNTPPASSSKNFFEFMNEGPLKFIQELDEKTKKMEDEIDALGEKLIRFIQRSHMLGAYPYERAEAEFGKEIAEIAADFSYGDPYEMCFALLYLLEQDSDLPWLYYPGIVLSENAGSMLPWYEDIYAEEEDSHWAQYHIKNFELGRPSITRLPEFADWYRLDYVYQKNPIESQFKNNLAQIVYDVTGSLMPRNLHGYDDEIRYLRQYGINGKKMQIPLLYCMTLLGEGRFQSKDWRQPFLFQEEEEGTEEPLDVPATVNELQDQLLALKKQNDQLKRIAYEAERSEKEFRKKNEDLLQKIKIERNELAELRELLFQRENDVEVEVEDTATVSFPCSVNHATVIFGGHDTWAKAIRPMLSGNIRFIDRSMRPDADLIRHAEVVWIQPNSLSHSNYHKIIQVVRTYHIDLHYFQFASAEKCAFQLVWEDRKMG